LLHHAFDASFSAQQSLVICAELRWQLFRSLLPSTRNAQFRSECSKRFTAQNIDTRQRFKGVRKGGWLVTPPWAWYFTKTLLWGECI